MVLVFFSIWIILPALAMAVLELKDLVIVGLAPFDGDIGPGIKPAVDLALQDINRHSSYLSRYNLSVHWVDTKCDMAIATKELFDLIDSGQARSFVFGDYCSNVTKPMAETVTSFNLSQVSYADKDPTLSDVKTYRSFLRTVPSEMDLNAAIVSFLQHNNWTKIFTLFQDASTEESKFAYTHDGLLSSLADKNIEINSTESLLQDPGQNLDHIVSKDGRIIIGYFDHHNALILMCKAYWKGVYGHKYVWILPSASSYPPDWWTDVSTTNCSRSQMEDVLHGYFTVDIGTSITDSNTKHIINGRPAKDYRFQYEVLLRGREESPFNAYAYDGIWLMALALQNTITTSDNLVNWSKVKSEKFISQVARTEFLGASGDVKFVNGSRQAQLAILQFNACKIERMGNNNCYELRKIGSYDMVDKKKKIDDSLIYWGGGGHGVPRDRILRKDETQKPNLYIQISLIILAVLGQFLAAAFLAVNIKYRKTRYIKMSSPNMNNIIIIGCFLIFVAVFLLRLDFDLIGSTIYQIVCIARTWVMSIGFSLAFGAMFAKTWRVYNIFHAPHKQKKAIKDHLLVLMVVGLVVIDLILLITWTIVDPLKIKTIRLPDEEDQQVQITPIIIQCKSIHMNVWASLFYAYKGLLLVAGCWFAWNTRKVSIPALNDSKYIGLSVYNVVIMCASAVSISYILSDQPDYLHLIIGCLIILCTTTTLCLVFGPKVMHLRKGDNNPSINRRPRVKLKLVKSDKSLSRQRSSELEANMQNMEQRYKSDILKLEKLNSLLEDKSLGHMSQTELTDKIIEYSVATVDSQATPSIQQTQGMTATTNGNHLTVQTSSDVDDRSDNNSGEIKGSESTGVTYVDSDVNINLAVTHSESRNRIMLRIQEIVQSPSFTWNSDIMDGSSLEVSLYAQSPSAEESVDFREEAGVTTPLIKPLITMTDGSYHDKVRTEILVTKQQLSDILDMQQSTHL